MDSCPPGSSVHGIFQARILEWVAISSSRGSSQPRDRTGVSCIWQADSLPLRPLGSQKCSNSVLLLKWHKWHFFFRLWIFFLKESLWNRTDLKTRMEVRLYRWDICYMSLAWKALLLAAPADSPHLSSKQQGSTRNGLFPPGRWRLASQTDDCKIRRIF